MFPWTGNEPISAIYKQGNRSLPENHLPISLTSILSKQLLKTHIETHMRNNNLFRPKQYGFISGRSTTLQLLRVLDKWTQGLDPIYMNLIQSIWTSKKPFEKAASLIHKIKSYSIHQHFVKWIETYLQNRNQYVSVNNKTHTKKSF